MWMGEEASDYFNKLLTKYNMDFQRFMKQLALEMWGDRINFKFCIPAGSQVSSQQTRLLLQPKDPSGVDCFEKIIKKIHIAQERVRLGSTMSAATIEKKLSEYEMSTYKTDRQNLLAPIGQTGRDYYKRRNQVPKAGYYSRIESGLIPTPNWTVFDEAYDDQLYREHCKHPKNKSKEESIVIKAGQEMADAKGNQENIDELRFTYSEHSFLKF